jgi:hypothetical protein
MNDALLRRRIAEVATDSSRMILTSHASMQMRKRRIVPTQVLHVLRKGYVVEHSHRNIKGNWQCTLEALVAGDAIRVAAALVTEPAAEWVVVITAMN